MRRHPSIPLVLPLLLLSLTAFGQPQPPSPPAAKPLAGKVLTVKLGNGELANASQWRGLTRQIDEAVTLGAQGFAFDIKVTDADAAAALPLAEEIARLPVRTLAFCNPSALGGGAFVALACDQIWMAPGARIGAAPPKVTPEKELSLQVQETILAEALARLKAGARSLARLKGHRVDVAEAFVDRSLGFQVEGRTLAGKGELLVLDAQDAASTSGGKPVLAHGVSPDLAAAARNAGLGESPQGLAEAIAAAQAVASKAAPPAHSPTPAKLPAAPRATNGGAPGPYAGKVVVIPVGEDDLMTRARFEFMSRTLARATAEGAEAVIFDLDTPGGLAWDTTNLMMNDLQKLSPKSFAFVNRRAMSAGAMIAVATDAIYMAPASSAGAATPVLMGGGELGAPERAKMQSAMMSMARTVAKEKGHDPRIIEAMIDPERDLVINGEVLFRGRKPLTLDADEAVMQVDGKPLFAKAILNSIDEIKAREGLKGTTVVAQPTPFESIAIWVTKYAAILILIGIAGGYLELQTPGFGIPGFISLAAFALFFFGHYVAGSMVGQEAAVAGMLFLGGVVLVVIELFFFPGGFVIGLAGLLCIAGALVYAMSAWEAPILPEGVQGFPLTPYLDALRNLALGLIGAVVIIILAARYLPQTRWFDRLVLSAAIREPATVATSGGGATAADAAVEIGQSGKAISALRPYGTVQFGDQRVEAALEGGYLPAGTDVRVRDIPGSKIVVEPIL